MSEERGWIRRHILAEAIGALVVLIVGALWYSAAVRGFAWRLIGYPVTFARWLGEPVSIPRWWHWVLIAVAVSVALWVVARLFAVARSDEPSVHDYTRDKILGIPWRWEWRTWGGGPHNITALCPRCDRWMPHFENRPFDTHTTFQCEECPGRIPVRGRIGRRARTDCPRDRIQGAQGPVARCRRAGAGQNSLARGLPAQQRLRSNQRLRPPLRVS